MMSNTRKKQEFLSYIRTPLSQNSLNVLYSANNIKFERCQLFSDIVQSLVCKIMDTYMGDNFTTPEQRLEHFKWCWDSTMTDFANEGINLKETRELYRYFRDFIMDSFYMTNEKGDLNITKEKLIKLWKYILSFTTNKTRSDVDTFLEVYRLFEKTIIN
jgi:hypothetical protein